MSLKLLGTTHILVLDSAIATRFYSLKSSAFNMDAIHGFFIGVLGNTPKRYLARSVDTYHQLEAPMTQTLMREPHLGKLISITCRNLEKLLPSFVSFSDRPIDQHSWELRAEVERKLDGSGQLSVELSLL